MAQEPSGRPYLNEIGLTEAYGTLSHSLAGSAVLGSALAGDANGGTAVYQSADRTVAPIGPEGIPGGHEPA